MPRLGDLWRPVHIERMIDQRLHTFLEAHGARQLGMRVERRLVDPARVDPKQSRIT
jgi:hypothetical protein